MTVWGWIAVAFVVGWLGCLAAVVGLFVHDEHRYRRPY